MGEIGALSTAGLNTRRSADLCAAFPGCCLLALTWLHFSWGGPENFDYPRSSNEFKTLFSFEFDQQHTNRANSRVISHEADHMGLLYFCLKSRRFSRECRLCKAGKAGCTSSYSATRVRREKTRAATLQVLERY